jgi:hypothetical protein
MHFSDQNSSKDRQGLTIWSKASLAAYYVIGKAAGLDRIDWQVVRMIQLAPALLLVVSNKGNLSINRC